MNQVINTDFKNGQHRNNKHAEINEYDEGRNEESKRKNRRCEEKQSRKKRNNKLVREFWYRPKKEQNTRTV